MIASLRGEVRHIGLDHVVIECGGVGYKVLVAPNTAGALTRGNEGFLLTSMVAACALHINALAEEAMQAVEEAPKELDVVVVNNERGQHDDWRGRQGRVNSQELQEQERQRMAIRRKKKLTRHRSP